MGADARGDRAAREGATATRAWNGSAWVARDAAAAAPATRWMGRDRNAGDGVDVVQGTGSFGYGGYQEGVGYEDARARAEAERAEQEKWARWEARGRRARVSQSGEEGGEKSGR